MTYVLPGAMLVLGELDHMVDEVLQLQVGNAVVAEVFQQTTAPRHLLRHGCTAGEEIIVHS